MAWSQEERELSRENKTFKMAEVEELMNNESGTVTRRLGSCARRAGNFQDKASAKEIGRDEILEHTV
jgi:hypothetical protein